MNRLKPTMLLSLTVVMFAIVVAHAQPNKELQSKKVKQNTASEIRTAPASISQTTKHTGSTKAYQLLTDVLDSFGGASSSTNYRIPVNSGGQPSAIGISTNANYKLGTGFIHASFVMRGDVTADGTINIADVVFLVNYLFTGGTEPCPMEAGDATCDGIVNIADVVYLVNYLFTGGPPPSC